MKTTKITTITNREHISRNCLWYELVCKTWHFRIIYNSSEFFYFIENENSPLHWIGNANNFSRWTIQDWLQYRYLNYLQRFVTEMLWLYTHTHTWNIHNVHSHNIRTRSFFFLSFFFVHFGNEQIEEAIRRIINYYIYEMKHMCVRTRWVWWLTKPHQLLQ